jgi:hypothetical protein
MVTASAATANLNLPLRKKLSSTDTLVGAPLTSSGRVIHFLDCLMKANRRRLDTYARPLRVILIVLGAIGAFAGFYGFFHERLWYQGYNARTGTFGTGDMLYLGFLGLIILFIGLVKPKRYFRVSLVIVLPEPHHPATAARVLFFFE